MNRVGLLVAALALALGTSCLGAESTVCTGGDGVEVLCPPNAICVYVGSAAACKSPDFSVCGNGVVESGEACDDGNTVSGDGCSADCTSNETCGNGVVDAIAGEQCDDGNLLSHDGCDSKCSAELPHWIQRAGDSLAGPVGRIAPGLTYDARHGQVLMFGGAQLVNIQVAVLGDTWLWANGWHQVFPFASPSPRTGCVLAYDGGDGDAYLFGGFDAGNAVLSDLWRWNGATWESVPTVGPPPEGVWNAAMAYDAHRQRLVLYGGTDGSGHSVDATWELDVGSGSGSASWLQTGTGADPGPRSGHVMAYDAVHENIVMWGGAHVVGTKTQLPAKDDTWTYDGSGWHAQTAASPPDVPTAGSGSGAAMGFDGSEIVLSTGGVPSVDRTTYVWDGSDWHDASIAGAGAGASRLSAAMAFVPPDQLMLFGGQTGGSAGFAATLGPGIGLGTLTFSSETDVWPAGGVGSGAAGSGSAFVKFVPPTIACAAEAAVLDLGLGAPIMFGGLSQPVGQTAPPTGSAGFSDLVDDNWLPLETTGSAPSPRAEVAGAFDESQVETILFGGCLLPNLPVALDDTWSWQRGRSGGEWRQETPLTSPPARIEHVMAYDAARKNVILFGGVGGDGSTLGDTWAWDGGTGTWSQDDRTPQPPARRDATLAYDRTHQQIVLFGGKASDGTLLSDTWLLTADGWSEAAPADAPSPRFGAALAWDPTRKRIVLFGGKSRVLEQDTWEWDGVRWTQLLIAPPPPRASGVLLGARDGLTLYGGGVQVNAQSAQFDDVWLLRYDGDHASENCRDNSDDDGDGLRGCKDPDCWLECTPMCLPGDACPTPAPNPSCGDQVCSLNETDDLCPSDCTNTICGDGQCSPTDCPGDCP